MTGCNTLSRESARATDWTAHAAIATDPQACIQRLQAATPDDESALDPAALRLVNWNMQKGNDRQSFSDLTRIAGDSDLVLLQEAAIAPAFLNPRSKARFWTFAPGYRKGKELTGVLTLSATMPLSRCSFMAWEPWLRSPKATNITQYALQGASKTLVVVNLHAVNYTFGLRHFKGQLEQIAQVLNAHEGPVILSGDFNTWRMARFRVMEALTASLALEPVPFSDDQRKLKFGLALDHVYVRGLQHQRSATFSVTTSDHNPMTVLLSR
ncbi:MAG: endonuclease/exonuclease/phosphatase family protein [Gammaproteobacteria bacterium]